MAKIINGSEADRPNGRSRKGSQRGLPKSVVMTVPAAILKDSTHKEKGVGREEEKASSVTSP